MNKKQENLRICRKGHSYLKKSSCRVCPICEKENKSNAGVFFQLSAPAQRALRSVGISTLQELLNLSETEIRSLHGIGPKAYQKIIELILENGLELRKNSN